MNIFDNNAALFRYIFLRQHHLIILPRLISSKLTSSGHTFAVKAVLSGIPLNVLQKWLSHSSIFVTSIYTDITGMDTSQFMNQMQ